MFSSKHNHNNDDFYISQYGEENSTKKTNCIIVTLIAGFFIFYLVSSTLTDFKERHHEVNKSMCTLIDKTEKYLYYRCKNNDVSKDKNGTSTHK